MKQKRKYGFVNTVCKKLGWGDRWYWVDLIRKSGGLLLGWGSDVTIHQIRSTNFSSEVGVEALGSEGKMWAIFVYACNKEKTRMDQWQELLDRKRDWGYNWILGGDFNDIRHPSDKAGGRPRTEISCYGFRQFIEKMEMEEIMFQGNQRTWANNWEEEGYVEVRLDRFFWAILWLLDHASTIVHHVE